MGKCWSFRGDDELDPDLEKWSKQHEKSFHIRQALRLYKRMRRLEIKKASISRRTSKLLQN